MHVCVRVHTYAIGQKGTKLLYLGFVLSNYFSVNNGFICRKLIYTNEHNYLKIKLKSMKDFTDFI